MEKTLKNVQAEDVMAAKLFLNMGFGCSNKLQNDVDIGLPCLPGCRVPGFHLLSRDAMPAPRAFVCSLAKIRCKKGRYA